MAVSALQHVNRPGRISLLLTLAVRVLFATLLFTAGGMGVGLLLGILGTLAWGMLHGGPIDMRNAYLHVAIPIAALSGTTAFIGSLFLEVRARRTTQER